MHIKPSFFASSKDASKKDFQCLRQNQIDKEVIGEKSRKSARSNQLEVAID
jgi:hypothetical protein